jgi:hypothetical protein
MASGRPKASPVWAYFNYNESAKESVCCIEKDEAICGVRVNGKNPTNLKQQLRKYNDKELKEVMLKEEEAKSIKKKSTAVAKSKVRQASMNSFLNIQPLSKHSKKHKTITTKLAVFIGTASVPYSLVENPEFRELFLELEPRYVVPGRNTITKEMLNVIAIMKTNIQEAIFLAKTIHLCCIIWSKKGMTESFLGVVAHFFAKNERHKATLAVRNIFGSHTGNNILGVMEQVLSEWNINKQAVGKVLTDNGSNIIKAFRDFQSSEIDDESVYDYMKDKSYVDLEDNECTTGADDATHTDNSDEDVDDETENRAKCNDTTIHVTSREIDEYHEHERDQNDVFSYNHYERLPCFPHTLQLVVSKFDEVKSCKDAICTAKKITARINKSVKATEMLRNLAGKKLLSDCPTRWSSTFLLLERLLK